MVREYDVRYGSSAPYVLPASIPDAADTDRSLPAGIPIFTYPGCGPTSRCSHAPRGTRLEPAGSPAASLVSRAVHRLIASGRTQSGLSPRDDIGIDPAPVVRHSEHSSDRRISQHPPAPASRSGSPPGAGDEPSQTRVPPSSTRSSWRPRNSKARCSTRASSSRAAAWQRTGRTRGRPIPTRRSNRSHRASSGSHHHRRQFGCRSAPSRPIRRRRARHHRGPQVRRRVRGLSSNWTENRVKPERSSGHLSAAGHDARMLVGKQPFNVSAGRAYGRPFVSPDPALPEGITCGMDAPHQRHGRQRA